ncbi:hypothetical protein ACQBAR_08360 [Propionibacteriaceae bacterium Y1685]|uniref:hypothetical protein n=1 Tax=Microlunatus sp. Y1700 TaxID=3418487 RepID=UPI003B770902
MLRKVLLFTAGMGVGVFVYLRARNYVRTKMPQAVTDTVNRTQERVRGSLFEFAEEARAAMAEREQELRDTLGLTDEQQFPTEDFESRPARHAR